MSIPKTMKAAYRTENGSFDSVLKVGTIDVPEIGPNEVLIEVRTSSVNPIDIIRIAGIVAQVTRVPEVYPVVDGYDVAGVVVAVGAEVTRFGLGDEVYGYVHQSGFGVQQYGPWAQYCPCHENRLARKGPSMSWNDAGSLGVAAAAAIQTFDRSGIANKPGSKVLITGGAGGVGTLAIQLAKLMFGASFVATTASASKADLLRDLGADLVIDYSKGNFADELKDHKFDLVFDMTAEGDKAVDLVAEGGALLTINGTPTKATMIQCLPLAADFERLAELYETGKVKSVVDSVHPLDDIVTAVGRSASKRANGKIIVTIA